MDETVGKAAFTEIHTVATEGIGEHSTCLFDENHGGSVIPGFSVSIDHRFESAFCQM